jgi:DNA mismatch repair ATPase MutS
MRAFLMNGDGDACLEGELPANADVLTQDLELDTLLDAMARGDAFLRDVSRRALLSSLTDVDSISYRQEVLADCLRQPAVVRRMYAVAVEGVLAPKRVPFGWLRDTPDAVLSRSVQVLELLVDVLKSLRGLADEHASAFHSDGFVRLFAMFAEELRDELFLEIEGHLRALRFPHGVLISAELGKGNKGRGYVLRRPRARSWAERVSRGGRAAYTFTVPDRDENGLRALAQLRARGIDLVADSLARCTDHILGFCAMLRAELGFYVGCLNLHERLEASGGPTCFPVPAAPGTSTLHASDLYDVPLTLQLGTRAVGNDLNADGKELLLVTGANQGGKSTFLRSAGVAQLMLQSGMFVAAARLEATVRRGVFTHYRREEDAEMRSGKLDEELGRMSEIADAIEPGCLLLCNESFAATNEREGSEIARQAVRAFLEAGVTVVVVTHLYDLAHGFHAQRLESALFLRAEREAGGRRSFRLVEGEPLPTSHGRDSYRRIFGRIDPARPSGDARAYAVDPLPPG